MEQNQSPQQKVISSRLQNPLMGEPKTHTRIPSRTKSRHNLYSSQPAVSKDQVVKNVDPRKIMSVDFTKSVDTKYYCIGETDPGHPFFF